MNAGIEHSWLTTADESLITRARNTTVATFLKTDYERLLFIDADIEFEPEDVSKLWNLNVDIAVAAYPMKRADHPPLSAWENDGLVEIKDRTEPFDVRYAGTGFMMIKREVFEKMQKKYPDLKHEEGVVGDCWGFFDCDYTWVHVEGRDMTKIHLSEDYAFCKRWRRMEGKIILDPTIRLKHWGNWCYGG